MKFILSLSLFLLPMLAWASIPAFPMAFWGSVTVDGNKAPAGALIRVYDSTNALVGEATVQNNGVYGYTEPTKQKLVISQGVGELTFSVQAPSVNGGTETRGITPVTYPNFESEETIQKNLSFVTKQKVVSGGGSSGGGGGGSGSKSSTKVKAIASAAVLGEATTTLTEEEHKIALQKQIIVLLTQLIALLQLKMAL